MISIPHKKCKHIEVNKYKQGKKIYTRTPRDSKEEVCQNVHSGYLTGKGMVYFYSFFVFFSIFSEILLFRLFVLTKLTGYYRFTPNCFRNCPQNEKIQMWTHTFQWNHLQNQQKWTSTERFDYARGDFLSTSNILTYLNQNRIRCKKSPGILEAVNKCQS